jgi:hypothetical protein
MREWFKPDKLLELYYLADGSAPKIYAQQNPIERPLLLGIRADPEGRTDDPRTPSSSALGFWLP